MPRQRPGDLAGRDDREAEHTFLPDFVWAAVGGLLFMVAWVVLYTLTVTWGGLQAGPIAADGGPSPVSAYYSQLAGFFLAGFLIVFVARSVSATAR